MSYSLDLLTSPLHIINHIISAVNSVRITHNFWGTQDDHLSIEDFDISSSTGFFPEQPLPRLPEGYNIWEDALDRAKDVLVLGENICDETAEKRAEGEEWRARIRSLPVISTDVLNMDKQLLRRAHKVLAFLVHFYVHSIPPAKSSGPTIVPRSLAIPLVEVSKVLGMAPVLTYLDTVVWNWEVIDPTLPVTIDNMRWVDIFSGTEDERNFFFAAARTEMRGIEIIQIINDYLSLPDVNDINAISKVSKNLNRLTVAIREIDEMVQEVREMVDPRIFYWAVRPWFNGSPSEEEGGEWIFEGVPNTRSFDLSGPSNGQSSMIHALDIFLAVDHKLQQRRYPAPSESNKRADHGFMDRMRRYMPGRHREYLSRLEANPRPLRELVQNTPVLREPYNAAVAALKKLRDRHMRVACLYVVTMSRSTAAGSKCPVLAMAARMEREGARKGPAKGTGGNDLSLLLKAGRDATQRTMLKSN